MGFARLGAECVDAALCAPGQRLLLVDPPQVDDNLLGDVAQRVTGQDNS
jgi:hypothetical protein